MTNQITLSLITAAVLGLNGCGGSSSNTTPATEEVTSITKLSEASQKHSKAEWDKLENEIQALDNTKDFNTMLLGSTEKNVASLTKVDIDKEMAYAMNSDVMFDDLTELDITDLDNQVALECTDNETCKEEAYASLNVEFEIDKEEAYAMSVMYREDIIKKPSTMDKLLKDFSCEAGLKRNVQFYGVEDNFSTANGDENATASQQIQNDPSRIAYNNNVNAGFANYDGNTQNRLFGEEVKNLPAGIQNGHFYIGMDNRGGNDRLGLGNMDNNSSTDDYFGWTISTNDGTLTKDGSVYHKDMSALAFQSGNPGDNLESYASTHNGFDVYVQDDTFVDFIAVATCSKPDPIKEITAIVNKFQCSEKETMLKILGGKIDAFAQGTDATTPLAPLASSSPTMDYDNTAQDKHLIDTLTLGLATGQTVSKAQFHIGYKSTKRSYWQNDALYLGEFGVNHAAFDLYTNSNSRYIANDWGINTISGNGETIASTDLNLSNAVGTGTVFSTMVSNGFLDVYLQDDTTVDFTQLNLCVKENCDEDAEDISLDLSQLASWTVKPSDAVQQNPIPNTWDNTLTWFDFPNRETNGHKVLEIPFCACSDTIVNINNFKADNNATIKLDGALVATQQAAGQAAMKADNNGGNHEDGSLTLAAGTNGGTNHVLRVDVTNQTLNFGVAMDGTLKFKGNLGKCN